MSHNILIEALSMLDSSVLADNEFVEKGLNNLLVASSRQFFNCLAPRLVSVTHKELTVDFGAPKIDPDDLKLYRRADTFRFANRLALCPGSYPKDEDAINDDFVRDIAASVDFLQAIYFDDCAVVTDQLTPFLMSLPHLEEVIFIHGPHHSNPTMTHNFFIPMLKHKTSQNLRRCAARELARHFTGSVLKAHEDHVAAANNNNNNFGQHESPLRVFLRETFVPVLDAATTQAEVIDMLKLVEVLQGYAGAIDDEDAEESPTPIVTAHDIAAPLLQHFGNFIMQDTDETLRAAGILALTRLITFRLFNKPYADPESRELLRKSQLFHECVRYARDVCFREIPKMRHYARIVSDGWVAHWNNIFLDSRYELKKKYRLTSDERKQNAEDLAAGRALTKRLEIPLGAMLSLADALSCYRYIEPDGFSKELLQDVGEAYLVMLRHAKHIGVYVYRHGDTDFESNRALFSSDEESAQECYIHLFEAVNESRQEAVMFMSQRCLERGLLDDLATNLRAWHNLAWSQHMRRQHINGMWLHSREPESDEKHNDQFRSAFDDAVCCATALLTFFDARRLAMMDEFEEDPDEDEEETELEQEQQREQQRAQQEIKRQRRHFAWTKLMTRYCCDESEFNVLPALSLLLYLSPVIPLPLNRKEKPGEVEELHRELPNLLTDLVEFERYMTNGEMRLRLDRFTLYLEAPLPVSASALRRGRLDVDGDNERGVVRPRYVFNELSQAHIISALQRHSLRNSNELLEALGYN